MYADIERWIDVRRAALAEGMSKRAVCRRFGLHWDSLQRILQHPIPPGHRRKQAAEKRVITPWLGRLGELVEASPDLPSKQRYSGETWRDALDHAIQGALYSRKKLGRLCGGGTGRPTH